MHEKELQQIGLSEKEAKVYLATLTLDKAGAQDIAKKADLKRPTTYFTLDLLMEKGLVSSIHEGKKQFFMAESPDRLLDVLHQRQDELKREGEKLQKIIPDLKKLRPKGEEGPVVKYYKGKEGALSMVKSLQDEVDDNGVWIIYPYDKVENIFSDEERQAIKFHNNRPKAVVRSMYTSSKDELESNEHMIRKKISDDENLPVSADIAVYGDVIRLASFSEQPQGIVIEDKEMADTMRTLFKLAWKDK